MATSLSEPLPPGGATGPEASHRAPVPPAGRGRRLLYGPPGRPRWARPALLALLLAAAVLYLWDLSVSGNANSFYAASVWAGTKSWKALFFASLDPSNAITVDKPPAALWVMALSCRVFGFHSWSMLLPQALEGIASVALLNAAVRRWHGPAAGLIAGGVLALTPVAAMMFRFNNPDAMLVLLMVLACYCTVRAVDGARPRWLVAAGVAVGTAFLAKMLQGWIVVPALGLAYLWAAPAAVGKRLLHLLAAAGAVIASTGWFVLAVALWPASSRPFIGGSTNNSEWELALGYNGLGRVFGQGGGAGGGGGGFGGTPGIWRMFHTDFGGEISWLLPSALLALAALAVLSLRAPRVDRLRASALIWGGWLLVNDAVFSLMSGIIHEYYTIALAPPIAALVGIGAVELWHRRGHPAARAALGAMTAAAAVWGFVLLGRDSSWLPWLRWAVLAAGLAAAVGLAVRAHPGRALAAPLAATALVAGLAGSAAWTLATVGEPHTGSIPTAGPAGAGQGGMGGGPDGGRFPGRSAEAADGPSGPAGGSAGAGASAERAGTADGRAAMGGTGGGAGGMGGRSSDSALTALLEKAGTRWAAAVVGDQSAADLELGSRRAVMALGGWSGSDDSPTLAQFEEYVAEGEIHYLVASGTGGMGGSVPGAGTGAERSADASGTGPVGGGLPGGAGELPGGAGGLPDGAPGGSSVPGGLFGGGQGRSSQVSGITAWVKARYKAITVGGETVYDLTEPAS